MHITERGLRKFALCIFHLTYLMLTNFHLAVGIELMDLVVRVIEQERPVNDPGYKRDIGSRGYVCSGQENYYWLPRMGITQPKNF